MSWFNYKEVKGMVSMSQLLERYQVRLRSTERPRQLKGDCPIPTHASNSRNTFNVNLDKNCWSCFALSCKRDEISGNVLGFVMAMEGCDLKTAAGKIVEWYGPKVPACSNAAAVYEKEGASSNGRTDGFGPENGGSIPSAPAEHTLVDWLEASTKKETSEKKEVSSEVVHAGDNPSPPDINSSPVPVNGKGYMKDVDTWFYSLCELKAGESFGAENYWKRVLTGVKARLIDSYKNGQKATTPATS